MVAFPLAATAVSYYKVNHTKPAARWQCWQSQVRFGSLLEAEHDLWLPSLPLPSLQYWEDIFALHLYLSLQGLEEPSGFQLFRMGVRCEDELETSRLLRAELETRGLFSLSSFQAS